MGIAEERGIPSEAGMKARSTRPKARSTRLQFGTREDVRLHHPQEILWARHAGLHVKRSRRPFSSSAGKTTAPSRKSPRRSIVSRRQYERIICIPWFAGGC
jgi:hypothetical protein